ncbi:MAG TPA: hypothetical protein VH475_24635 [Tepidisphaeraceae bacterium]
MEPHPLEYASARSDQDEPDRAPDSETRHVETLEYASAGSDRALWLAVIKRLIPAFDVTALVFVVSQYSFLFAMAVINIHECGVPPYGHGSSYNDRALGSADDVADFPRLAAWIASVDKSAAETLGGPAFLANLLSFTVFSYVLSAYLVVRAIMMRGTRRVVMAALAVLMVLTLPFIWAAVVVGLD